MLNTEGVSELVTTQREGASSNLNILINNVITDLVSQFSFKNN